MEYKTILLIGVSPRCGTNYLFKLLELHSSIVATKIAK